MLVSGRVSFGLLPTYQDDDVLARKWRDDAI